MAEAMNAERRARGQKRIEDVAKLAKRQTDFEKAYYGKLRHSEKGRRVVDLLRAWHGGQIIEQHGWCRRPDNERIALLAPFLDAVRTFDVKFFRLLTQAAQMLETRIRSSKDASIGTGDTTLTCGCSNTECGLRGRGRTPLASSTSNSFQSFGPYQTRSFASVAAISAFRSSQTNEAKQPFGMAARLKCP